MRNILYLPQNRRRHINTSILSATFDKHVWQLVFEVHEPSIAAPLSNVITLLLNC
jgi:hypothetical protein